MELYPYGVKRLDNEESFQGRYKVVLRNNKDNKDIVYTLPIYGKFID